MAFETVKPYFQSAIKAVDASLEEWVDAFNIANIPQTQLDCAWHFSHGNATFIQYDQGCLSYLMPVTLRFFFKGYRSPADAVDNAVRKAEAIIKESCRHSRRLNQPYIKQVVPKDFNAEALDNSNDNTVVLVMSFDCRVHLDLET